MAEPDEILIALGRIEESVRAFDPLIKKLKKKNKKLEKRIERLEKKIAGLIAPIALP